MIASYILVSPAIRVHIRPATWGSE